jgi:hypothetical protein
MDRMDAARFFRTPAVPEWRGSPAEGERWRLRLRIDRMRRKLRQ